MSKLFDILNTGKGDIADLARTLLEGETGQPTPQTEVDDAAARLSAPVEELIPADPPPAREVLPQIRTLPLRVPAPSPLLPFETGHSRPSEQYRILRTKIDQNAKQSRLIAVSSPAIGDGKTVTAINTAAALSLKSETRVLLLDADFRKSAIHTQLGLPESPGLAEVLQGTSTVEEALVRALEFPNLYVMTSGRRPENPVELLDSSAWHALCEKIRPMFQHVLVDSPPIGVVADYDLIQAQCDGVIVVVRPDCTKRQLCFRALETIPKAKFLGVLLNCVPEWSLARGAAGDHYYYSGENSYQTTKK